MENPVYGECAKHKGQSMINCPICEMEKSSFSPELKQEIDRVAAMGEALLQHTEEIKTKTQYVWVTYDPLYERVVCVHSKLQSDCKKCRTIRKKRWKENSVYFLETSKFKIKP